MTLKAKNSNHLLLAGLMALAVSVTNDAILGTVDNPLTPDFVITK